MPPRSRTRVTPRALHNAHRELGVFGQSPDALDEKHSLPSPPFIDYEKIKRERLLWQLRHKRYELLEAIVLLKKGIRKRHLPFKLLAMAMLLGTVAYLIYDWFSYLRFQQELDNRAQTLEGEFTQLRDQIPQLVEKAQKLEDQKSQLKHAMATSNYVQKCTVPDEPWVMTVSCDDFLNPRKRRSFKMCGDIGSDGKYLHIDNPCSDLGREYNQVMRGLPISTRQRDKTKDKMNETWWQLKKINYGAHYQWIGNAINLYLLAGLVMSVPLTYFLIYSARCANSACVTIKNFLTDFFSYTRCCFNLSPQEHARIITIANKFRVEHHDLDFYGDTLQEFQTALSRNAAAIKMIELQDRNAEARWTFLASLKKQEKSSALGKFYGPTRERELLTRKIFYAAGLATPAMRKAHDRAEQQNATKINVEYTAEQVSANLRRRAKPS